MTDRALAPVVGKLLEVGIVTLYITTLLGAMYGGIVPEYRSATGEEVAERTVVSAAQEIQRAVPATTHELTVERRIGLPTEIYDRQYEIRAEDEQLILDHRRSELDRTVRLAVPERVDTVSGSWRSTGEQWIVVHGDDSGVSIELVEDDPR